MKDTLKRSQKKRGTCVYNTMHAAVEKVMYNIISVIISLIAQIVALCCMYTVEPRRTYLGQGYCHL